MADISFFPLLLSFALGLCLGALLVWLSLRSRGDMQTQLSDTFKALASDTLHANSAAFLQMAENKLHQKGQSVDAMIKPVSETLQKMDAQIQALEIKREGAYRELSQMVSASRETQTQLRNETSQLLQALRAPTGRGRWGELQLQRILEMTGMSAHAQDFATQVSFSGGDEDANIRPDFIVSLPGNLRVIIDSKVPLTAYLDFVQANDDTLRGAALKQHARHLKDHIKTLSSKSYWEKVEGTPAFVVLFLPGEHFLSAALDGDGSLMEYSTQNQVVLATPMTLIALLRTVSYGWRQEALQENARQIAELGGKLLSSMNVFSEHLGRVGGSLGNAVDAYNKTVGSLERNVLVKARRLAEYGAGSGEAEIEPPSPVEREPRLMIVGTENLKIVEK